MTTELTKDILASEHVREYDENVKNILANKMILAHIISETVEEVKGMEPEEIIPLIEGEPEIGIVPVEPGLTNSTSKIQGNNTEDVIINEGVVTFDIRFYIKYPLNKKKISDNIKYVKLLIDVEAQKDFYPGYDLVVRGIYYAARQLSSQKGVEFEKSDYNNLKKVYSIWICMNPPKYCENTIIKYSINQEVMLGKIKSSKQFRYDLMQILIVNLPLKVPDKIEKPTITGMLKTLLTPELSAESIMDRLERIYHIPMTEQKGDVGDMCNLGEAIWERGIERGIEQGVKAFIELCKEMNISKEETSRKAQLQFEMSKNTVKRYVKKYYG